MSKAAVDHQCALLLAQSLWPPGFYSAALPVLACQGELISCSIWAVQCAAEPGGQTTFLRSCQLTSSGSGRWVNHPLQPTLHCPWAHMLFMYARSWCCRQQVHQEGGLDTEQQHILSTTRAGLPAKEVSMELYIKSDMCSKISRCDSASKAISAGAHRQR